MNSEKKKIGKFRKVLGSNELNGAKPRSPQGSFVNTGSDQRSKKRKRSLLPLNFFFTKKVDNPILIYLRSVESR